jgi:hypothetical protein
MFVKKLSKWKKTYDKKGILRIHVDNGGHAGHEHRTSGQRELLLSAAGDCERGWRWLLHRRRRAGPLILLQVGKIVNGDRARKASRSPVEYEEPHRR